MESWEAAEGGGSRRDAQMLGRQSGGGIRVCGHGGAGCAEDFGGSIPILTISFTFSFPFPFPLPLSLLLLITLTLSLPLAFQRRSGGA